MNAIPGTSSRRAAIISEQHRSCNTIFLCQMNLPLPRAHIRNRARYRKASPGGGGALAADFLRRWRRSHDHLSFTNAKLTENRIENLFHIYDANYFADRSQRLIKINSNVFRRESLAQGRLRAIA